GIVILVNKWDKIQNKETNTMRDYERNLKSRLEPFSDVPVVFISAKEKTKIFQATEKAIEVFENKNRRIPTSKVNETLLKEIERFPPPLARGHAVKIQCCLQVPSLNPALSVYANHPNEVRALHRHLLAGTTIEQVVFAGVPILIFMPNK